MHTSIGIGNTVVGKPSEITPATASVLGELSIEAGFPRGVLNIVHGCGDPVGRRLVEHPDVGTITFTGGTSTGAAISATAGPMFKRLSLELGGKNPVIICDDADLDRAMPQILRSSFSNQGEICLCGSRILVHRSRMKEFTDRFVEMTRGLKVGDPLDPETDRAMICGSMAMLKDTKALLEAAGLTEGANNRPAEFVIERAFVG